MNSVAYCPYSEPGLRVSVGRAENVSLTPTPRWVSPLLLGLVVNGLCVLSGGTPQLGGKGTCTGDQKSTRASPVKLQRGYILWCGRANRAAAVVSGVWGCRQPPPAHTPAQVRRLT